MVSDEKCGDCAPPSSVASAAQQLRRTSAPGHRRNSSRRHSGRRSTSKHKGSTAIGRGSATTETKRGISIYNNPSPAKPSRKWPKSVRIDPSAAAAAAAAAADEEERDDMSLSSGSGFSQLSTGRLGRVGSLTPAAAAARRKTLDKRRSMMWTADDDTQQRPKPYSKAQRRASLAARKVEDIQLLQAVTAEPSTPREPAKPVFVSGKGDHELWKTGHWEDEEVALSLLVRTQLVIARALVSRPVILLMEDIMTTLDKQTKVALMKSIAAVSSDFFVVVSDPHLLPSLKPKHRSWEGMQQFGLGQGR